MKLRYLRISWSVGWGLLTVVLIVLWVRGYWWSDIVAVPINSERMVVVFSTSEGIYAHTYRLVGGRQNYPLRGLSGGIPNSFEWLTGPVFRQGGYPHRMFAVGSSRELIWVRFPRWLPLLLCAAIAVIPWHQRTGWRFSLRTIFIAMTLVNIALGTIIALSR